MVTEVKKNCRIGIIGAGSIVENSHLPVLKNIQAAGISWIYDKNTVRSELISSMYGVPVIDEPSLESAMDDVDVCLLTIPYGVRARFIEMCAVKEKALYAEKPFATSVQEHEAYCGLFPFHKLAIGFQRRYYKIVSTLGSIISSGVLGQLTSIQFTQGYFSLKGGGGYLSDAALAGGGVIIESAIHALDQLLIASGAISVEVMNVKSIHKKGIDYDTKFDSLIKTFTQSIPVNCEISTLRNLSNGVKLQFENAVLKCNLSHDARPVVFKKDGALFHINLEDLIIKDNTATSINKSFFIFWNQFLESLHSKTENLTHASTSLITTSWISQIYRNIRQ